MKKRLELKNCKGVISNAKSQGWALCIGAGTSYGIFPDWDELVDDLYSEIEGPSKICGEVKNLYSLDAVLQAGFEVSALSEVEYSNLLSKLLYKKSKEIMTKEEFSIFSNILSTESSHRIYGNNWEKFIDIREKHLKNTSAYHIAKIISEICDGDLKPDNILSFNAEIMLFALINSFIVERFSDAKMLKLNYVKKHVDLVNRSISNSYRDRINYILCHGVLPVPERYNRVLTATDKLVFRESEYLNLANNSFSWQASSFLNICSTVPIVFIGVSLSDSNMRRWLSWIHNNREKEFEHLYKKKLTSTTHFWIQKKCDCLDDMKWVEAAVYHLGVRIVWIDKWDEVSTCLRNMIGHV